jgi:cytochrome c oxidase subunit 2
MPNAPLFVKQGRAVAALKGALALLASVPAVLAAGAAQAGTGQPTNWQLGFQGSVTEVMDFITDFHNALLVLITLITLFVAALLVYVMVKFSEKRNPVPSRTTHHAGLEVAWTVIPILILVAIAIPSFRLLKMQLVPPPADVTIKATGHAWYWSYEYPKDQGGFVFESNMLTDQQIAQAVAAGRPRTEVPRLLAVDNEVVVPVNKVVRLQVTAADVLHAFAMPSFGIKIDAVPGRLNETWFKATREGVYFGQCSELCGQNHAFMPIAIRVVSDAQYASWLEQAKQKFASTDPVRQTASLSAAPVARD